jgi:hypothetical protein
VPEHSDEKLMEAPIKCFSFVNAGYQVGVRTDLSSSRAKKICWNMYHLLVPSMMVINNNNNKIKFVYMPFLFFKKNLLFMEFFFFFLIRGQPGYHWPGVFSFHFQILQ